LNHLNKYYFDLRYKITPNKFLKKRL